MTTEKDYQLSPDQLDGKYNPDGDGQHPDYQRKDWREAVDNHGTISGYWEWVRHMLLDRNEEVSGPRWVVVSGNPIDGFKFFGPFEIQEDAVDYMDRLADGCWTTKLETPSK